jgi:SRSO17 transposase
MAEQQAAAEAAADGVAVVAGWGTELDLLHAHIAPRFARTESRQRALAYLRGLLSPLERKNGWQLAEQAGDASPDGVQDFLNRSNWDAAAVRDDLRTYVVEHLGDPAAVLVLDETGLLKKGTHSVGVQRQYSGTAGRVENCQIAVFLTYAAPRGRTFLDRALYLPHRWTDDRARCDAAGIPAAVGFQTKPHLAQTLLARAKGAGVPFGFATGDCVYGADPGLRHWLEQELVPYVLAIRKDAYLAVAHAHGEWRECVQTLTAALPATAWQRLSAGEGAQGPRWSDWALVTLAEPAPAGWAQGLLVRRSPTDPTAVAYYRTFAPLATPLATLVAVAGARWAIEDTFETGNGEVGLDEYEVRRWDAWHRHITLALLAHAYLTVVQAQAADTEAGAKKGGRAATAPGTARWRRGRTCCR